jgi:type II secretory pathway pseudopilin PulG
MDARPAISTACRCAERGFSYIALLVLIAVMGVAMAATGDLWATASQREKEAQLLFVGHQFRQAIMRFHEQAGAVKRYPTSLDELLLDPRFPEPHRYLRRIYLDPMTGTTDWGLVKGANDEIVGVYSQSQEKPIKQANFRPEDAAFEAKDKYSDWQFVYLMRHNQAVGSAASGVQNPTPSGPNRATPYQNKPTGNPLKPFTLPMR